MVEPSEREAGAHLLAWLDERLGAAEVEELARLLRELRRQGQRRRRRAREAFVAAFLARVGEGEREEVEAGLRWLMGERWLPPAAADLELARRRGPGLV